MISSVLRLAVFLAVVPIFTANAADTVLGPSCNLAVVGATDKQPFVRFDKELRAALSRQDVAAIALLVSFPLGVNYRDGTKISIDNVKGLQTRFAEVFPPRVRSAILNQKLSDIFCKDTGIMYGRGEVWIRADAAVARGHYRMTTINLPPPNGRWVPYKQIGLQFVCETEEHRVVIDADASGKLRYRSWNQPRAITDKPDVEITSGKLSFEGSDPCTHAIWTFQKGKTQFSLSELGCTDGSEPKGSTGELTTSIDSNLQETSWCR